jgi:hypothetical protein
MAQLQELVPVLSDLLLLILAFGSVGFWAYSVATYDWSKFEEDSANDDFLKPYDK